MIFESLDLWEVITSSRQIPQEGTKAFMFNELSWEWLCYKIQFFLSSLLCTIMQYPPPRYDARKRDLHPMPCSGTFQPLELWDKLPSLSYTVIKTEVEKDLTKYTSSLFRKLLIKTGKYNNLEKKQGYS